MKKRRPRLVSIAVLFLSLRSFVFGQDGKPRGSVKPVTVPGLVSIAVLSLSLSPFVFGQDGKPRGSVKPVTVPVTIRIRDAKPVEMRIVDYLLREDGEMQTILSARTPNDSPLTLAVLMQDDLDSSASVEARNIATFIRNQPGNTRVMIGYIRSGSLEMRRKFTVDLERAAQRD